MLEGAVKIGYRKAITVAATGAQRVDEAEIRARIDYLRLEHRDLDAAIDALRLAAMPDMIQLQRFKKRKLRLKDEISVLEDQLIPDIIA